jgi:hypothetical protein
MEFLLGWITTEINIACAPEIRNGRDPNTSYQHTNGKAETTMTGFSKKRRVNEKTDIRFVKSPKNKNIIKKGHGSLEKFLFALLATCLVVLLALYIRG